MKDRDTPHGTNGGYVNHGCRCDPCRTASRAYSADYDQRNRDKILAARRRYRTKHRDELSRKQADWYWRVGYLQQLNRRTDAAIAEAEMALGMSTDNMVHES